MNTFKSPPPFYRSLENGAFVFSFSSTSSKPLPKKIFRKRKRFFGHWSASSTAHSSIRAEKKSLLPSAILSDGTKHNSSQSLLYGLCSAPSDNANKKQFFSARIPLSFPPLITVSYPYKDFRWVSLSNPTIFCTKCSPHFFQHHSQFPPLPKFLQPMFGIPFTEIGPFHSCLTCAD